MGFIAEFLFELIVEGSWEASSDKKVPLAVRIIAGLILMAVYGALIGVCFFIGIHDRKWIVLVLGIVILVITVLGVRTMYKNHKE